MQRARARVSGVVVGGSGYGLAIQYELMGFLDED